MDRTDTGSGCDAFHRSHRLRARIVATSRECGGTVLKINSSDRWNDMRGFIQARRGKPNAVSLHWSITLSLLRYHHVEDMIACVQQLDRRSALYIEFHWQDDTDSRNAWHLLELLLPKMNCRTFGVSWWYVEFGTPDRDVLSFSAGTVVSNLSVERLHLDLRGTYEGYNQEPFDPLCPVMGLGSWLPGVRELTLWLPGDHPAQFDAVINDAIRMCMDCVRLCRIDVHVSSSSTESTQLGHLKRLLEHDCSCVTVTV